ncbi:MAG: ATP-binding protein [Dehalococcoidia bacterium]
MQRATALVRQLLQFSRSGDTAMRNESVTLVDVRTLAREAAEGLAEDPVGPVVLDLPRQAVIATVDPTRVHRVLMNLLVNARDAVQDVLTSSAVPFRPEIRLAVRATAVTEERAAGVELEVRDNGGGMSAQVRDRVFEPFFTTKPVGRGTGLGLPTVYGTVRDMSGTIELTSQLGQGTSFRVWLPVTPPARSVPHGSADGSRRVLILDDQEELLEFSAESLRRAGFTVATATTSNDALAKLQEGPYDLAILDAFVDEVTMPELLSRIRRLRPDQRVMACSGSASRAQAIAWGADEYLAKPFSSEVLVRTVREIIGAPVDPNEVSAAPA